MDAVIIVIGVVLLWWLFCDCKHRLKLQSVQFCRDAVSLEKRLECERNLLDNVGKSLVGESAV